MNEEKLKTERKFIYLLLHNFDLISDWVESSLKREYFCTEHRTILSAIIDSYDQKVLLTRTTFYSYISKLAVPRDIVEQENEFNICYRFKTDKNNFPHLSDEILDDYLLDVATSGISKFNVNREKKGNRFAIKELYDNLNDLTNKSLAKDEIIYEDIKDYFPTFIQHIDDIRSGKIKEDKIICGIKEIDSTMVTGFARGTLTLFCADIGSYKSTIMMNIGLNIWQRGYNVLFIPIEMSARQQMYKRVVAR